MPPIVLTSPSRPATFAFRAVASLRAGVGRLLRRREFVATVRTLDCLDDHTLRDIGLCRDDIVAGVRRRLDG